jgi:hypothetical protein
MKLGLKQQLARLAVGVSVAALLIAAAATPTAAQQPPPPQQARRRSGHSRPHPVSSSRSAG